MKATIADIEESIIGFDFIQKYRLNFEWNEFGDMVLHDKKSKTSSVLKCVTVPVDSFRSAAVRGVLGSFDADKTAFEVASMRALPENPVTEKIPEKYSQHNLEMDQKKN